MKTVIPSDRTLNSHQTIMDSFPSTIAFRLKNALFYQFNAQISTSATKKLSVWLLSTTLMSKCLAENDVKTSKTHPEVMHGSRLTPPCKMTVLYPCVRRHFLAAVNDAEIPVRYARNKYRRKSLSTSDRS